MKKSHAANGPALTGKIFRYGCAAGAGVLASPLTLADGFDFTPEGGLPIIIDTSITDIDPLEIDLDGDATDDFEIFYLADYGGGFVIRALDLDPSAGGSAIQAQRASSTSDNLRATRNDLTEYITVDDSSEFGFQYPDYIGESGRRIFIDSDGTAEPILGIAPEPLSAFTPFRDNPGFLGLSLGTPTFAGGFAGTLQVEINSDGTELTILGGSYRQDGLDLYLGEEDLVFKDGFETASDTKIQAPATLLELAFGKQD